MATLKTTDLDLAAHQGETWSKNITTGVLAKLAVEAPDIKVGKTDHFVFTGTPKAELVGEGANKSSADDKPTKATVNTYKVQVTYRFSDEVQYEDEDYQTQLIDGLVKNISIALSRALDLVAIHGINPKTGEASSSVVSYFAKAGNKVARVVATEKPNEDIENAAAKLQEAGYTATGVGFDPAFAGELARVTNANGVKLYPELGLGFNVDNFQGLMAASSDTVSGRQEITKPRVKGIMGDFRAFKWGVARYVGLKLIEAGDPDGAGDLNRTNEVAIRAESIFGYAIFDEKAFSLVEKAAY
jgi:Phage capsid family.|nr:MAG TPA: major capsid protein [Bacteriophage sp.]